VTCPDVRAQLPALVDDDLAPSGRPALDAHLATCPECRHELARLRATVAALRQLGPARAPAGFVDRVVAAAFPRPWYRRLGDALFVPIRLKLPLEAAAVLLVAASAVYLHQRTPEVSQLAHGVSPSPPDVPSPARQTARAPAASVGRSGPAGADELTAGRVAGQGGGVAPPREAAPPARRETGPAREVLAARPPGDPVREGLPAAPAAQVPAAGTPGDAGSPPPSARPDASSPGPAAPESQASAPLPATAKTAPAAARPGAEGRAAQESPPGPGEDRPRTGPGAPAASAPAASAERAAKALGARLSRTPDASGRLLVAARAPAEAALDELLPRVGATRLSRRAGGAGEPVVVELLVPAARYGELTAGLGRIGRWTPAREPAVWPADVRIEVAITDVR
jgi:anti-sigma factor RsiW